MLNVCLASCWLDKAPKLPQYAEPRVHIRWEPPQVISSIIDHISLPWLRDAAIVAVATGMRESELFSLQPSGVSIEKQSAWVSDFTWHDLRHAWASWHVQAGTPLMVLKELEVGADRDGAEVRASGSVPLGRACQYGQILLKLGAGTKNAA